MASGARLGPLESCDGDVLFPLSTRRRDPALVPVHGRGHLRGQERRRRGRRQVVDRLRRRRREEEREDGLARLPDAALAGAPQAAQPGPVQVGHLLPLRPFHAAHALRRAPSHEVHPRRARARQVALVADRRDDVPRAGHAPPALSSSCCCPHPRTRGHRRRSRAATALTTSLTSRQFGLKGDLLPKTPIELDVFGGGQV